MRGITITDHNDGNVLTVDLVDILHVLGSCIEDTEWEIAAVEAVGTTAADKLQRLGDSKARVPGRTLLELAATVTQVIDGQFVGYRPGQDPPWIILRAIDSSAYDVQSEDEDVISRMREHFKSVADLPSFK